MNMAQQNPIELVFLPLTSAADVPSPLRDPYPDAADLVAIAKQIKRGWWKGAMADVVNAAWRCWARGGEWRHSSESVRSRCGR